MIVHRIALATLIATSAACGSSSSNNSNNGSSSTTTTYTWSADIASIVSASCGGSGCHASTSTGSGATVWVGNETAFKADKTSIKDRIGRASSDALFMPKSPGTLSAADKAKILSYLGN